VTTNQNTKTEDEAIVDVERATNSMMGVATGWTRPRRFCQRLILLIGENPVSFLRGDEKQGSVTFRA